MYSANPQLQLAHALQEIVELTQLLFHERTSLMEQHSSGADSTSSVRLLQIIEEKLDIALGNRDRLNHVLRNPFHAPPAGSSI